ncbi:MAG: hypothetical protein AAGC63_05865 [Propionicimonas sp.]|nr:hypothetical protein [Propionicimonas sp.]
MTGPVPPDRPRWHAAIAAALVGEELDLPEPGRPEIPGLLADLAREGWPAARIAGHARSRVAGEQPWPHQIPPRLRAGCGAAQLHAALAAARNQLGLGSLEVRGPSRRTRLDSDEQRLMRDVPPHHGS